MQKRERKKIVIDINNMNNRHACVVVANKIDPRTLAHVADPGSSALMAAPRSPCSDGRSTIARDTVVIPDDRALITVLCSPCLDGLAPMADNEHRQVAVPRLRCPVAKF